MPFSTFYYPLNPCFTTNTIDEWKRSVANPDYNDICDNLLIPGWYRIKPKTSPFMYMCLYIYRFYLCFYLLFSILWTVLVVWYIVIIIILLTNTYLTWWQPHRRSCSTPKSTKWASCWHFFASTRYNPIPCW
jgi:hypothetical protein